MARQNYQLGNQQRCNSTPLSSILKQKRPRWLGHVHRMPIDRLPKQIMYGELTEGKRPVGRPKLRHKDVIKRDLKDCGIEPMAMHWQTVAEERPTWRTSLTGGSAIYTKAYQIHKEIKRARCHARNQPTRCSKQKHCLTRQKLATTIDHICYGADRCTVNYTTVARRRYALCPIMTVSSYYILLDQKITKIPDNPSNAYQ